MTDDDLFPDAPDQVSLERQIACVEREIAQRRLIYPRLVAGGKMMPAQAREEIVVMKAVLFTLSDLLAVERAPR